MTDLIFSQLEEIGNDTFLDFAPYTPPQLDSKKKFDKDVDGFFENMEFEELEVRQEPSKPIEIKLSGIDMQDFRGYEIDSSRISKPKLRLQCNFFGLEIEDSMKGRSIIQFFPSDITVIVRQCDRIGIYFQFRKQLRARQIREDTQIGNFESEDKFYTDSPFNSCLYLMLEFKQHSDVSQVFKFINENETLMSALRIVYEDWMYCSRICTSSDIHFIQLAQDNVNNISKIRKATIVTAIPGEVTERKNALKKVQSPYKWAITAKKQAEIMQTATLGWSSNSRRTSMRNQAALDLKKIHQVLPPAFLKISEDVRKFAEKLLVESSLKPYQLTVGLCGALSVAQTSSAKLRAKSILWALSKHPNVQLSNVHQVARFLLEKPKTASIQPKQMNCQPKPQQEKLLIPTLQVKQTDIIKRNASKARRAYSASKLVTYGNQPFSMENKKLAEEMAECPVL